MNSLRLLAVAAALAAAPALGAQQKYGRDMDTWRWEGKVEAGRWMRVFNINGSVDFLPSPDNMVHVVAEKRSSGGQLNAIHFEVVQVGGNVTICAIWQDNSRCEEDGIAKIRRNDDNNDNRSSVRFTVRVPKSLRIGAQSVNGAVSVRDVGAEVKAQTVNGGVVVRNTNGRVRAGTVNGGVDVNTSAGPVSAETVNGDVEAKMATLQGNDDMTFKTVNGTVSIYVPSSFDANFRFDTVGGDIDSDFPMNISGRFGPRHASGTIGRGGRDLRASTVNGSIELRKQ